MRRSDHQEFPGRLDADPLGGQADVPGRQPLRKLVGGQADTVVLDQEEDAAVGVRQPDEDARGARVRDDVCEELARGGEQQLLA